MVGILNDGRKSAGRLTFLSPVTWKDGWPYFGLEGNLGRSPRTWFKPDTGTDIAPLTTYQRDDDFSSAKLKPIWQWNHIPVDKKWSLTEKKVYCVCTLSLPKTSCMRKYTYSTRYRSGVQRHRRIKCQILKER